MISRRTINITVKKAITYEYWSDEDGALIADEDGALLVFDHWPGGISITVKKRPVIKITVRR